VRLGLLGSTGLRWGQVTSPVDYQHEQPRLDINLVVVSPTHVVEEMAKIGTIKLACLTGHAAGQVSQTHNRHPLVGVDLTRLVGPIAALLCSHIDDD